MLVMVAVVGGRRPRRRLRGHYGRRIRRGLLADGERGRRGALLLLDPIELVNSGGDELLDGGDVVVTSRILVLNRAELGAQGVQGILGGLRSGGPLSPHPPRVGRDTVGAPAGAAPARRLVCAPTPR